MSYFYHRKIQIFRGIGEKPSGITRRLSRRQTLVNYNVLGLTENIKYNQPHDFHETITTKSRKYTDKKLIVQIKGKKFMESQLTIQNWK